MSSVIGRTLIDLLFLDIKFVIGCTRIKMYFLVKMKETAQKAIIPQKWILNLDWEKLLTYGKKYIKRITFSAFICNDISNEPDFGLAIKNVLDTTRPACYKVFVIDTFGKQFSIRFCR